MKKLKLAASLVTALFVNSSFGQNIVVKAGTYQAFEIRDGSLWAWGDNDYGELGIGNRDHKSVPTPIGFFNDWEDVYPGDVHTIAKRSNGTLWGWGHNNFGQMGQGYANSTDFLFPVQVGNESDWLTAAAGIQHTVAIKTNGTLWSWGLNNAGQLGQPNGLSPSQVGLANNWKQVSAGYYYSAGVRTDGTLWVWGDNSQGQLGQGDFVQRSAPVQVGTDHNWVSVACGYYFCLALKSDGTLWAWGDNSFGQLGTGKVYPANNEHRDSIPQRVGVGINWLKVTAGKSHALGIKTDSSLYSWGANNSGQLGLGFVSPVTIQTVPARVGTENVWISISTDGEMSMAKKASTRVFDWGLNNYGQLGQGYSGNGVGTPTQLDLPVVVPVKLASFTGQINKLVNELTWVSNNEEGLYGYEIQRSTDGKNFTAIGTVKAQATPDLVKTYHYTDQFPPAEIGFYRLRTIDVDLRFTYSRVIAIRRNVERPLIVFPNPASDHIQIQVKTAGTAGTQKLEVMDLSGRIVRRIDYDGRNETYSFALDVSKWPAGMYFIRSSDGGTATFVKQ
jgi:alpha-tubulin suppressor-like RCC1 family protein